jgi:hypothetical protein
MAPSKQRLTKESFDSAVKTIDGFIDSYYKNKWKVSHIDLNDDVLEAIKLVKAAVNSLLHLEDNDFSWVRSSVVKMREMSAKGEVVFGDKREEVDNLFDDIISSIAKQRGWLRQTLVD